VTIALSLQAPGQVRRSLESHYSASMDRRLLNDVVLLASEIVTNAVQHSGCPNGDPLAIQASLTKGVFRVEVTDRGPGVHNLQARSIEPPSGLGYVQLLSDRWSSRVGESFHVWFEIDVVSRPVFYRAADSE
jgi:anti-sigma regulatory factor (Ser/Thr protein kinase)